MVDELGLEKDAYSVTKGTMSAMKTPRAFIPGKLSMDTAARCIVRPPRSWPARTTVTLLPYTEFTASMIAVAKISLSDPVKHGDESPYPGCSFHVRVGLFV